MVTQAEIDADVRATELVNAMAALPAEHPERGVLRTQAIEAWTPMARRLTHRYVNRGEESDDLTQVAVVGLIKAVDRFDPSVGVAFPGFAIPTILGEVRRHFRDRAWSIRVPRRLQELGMAVNAARAELDHVLHRSPTVTEVAQWLDASEEEVLEALESSRAYRAVSLSTPVDQVGELSLGDTLGTEEQGYALAEFHADLPAAMASLTDRERQIIKLRFYDDMTQTRIAEELGISQMHVSRLLSATISKLRVRMT